MRQFRTIQLCSPLQLRARFTFRLSSSAQVFQRFLQVFARFSGWATRAWAQWGSRRSAEEQLAQELREALVELGPSFVSLGVAQIGEKSDDDGGGR